MAQKKYILTDDEPKLSHSSDELAQILMYRIGLAPRKKGATESMYKVLLSFYEQMKVSHSQKDPKISVLTVEEMAHIAQISRQTMYEYLERWTTLHFITKVSFYDNQKKLVTGYKLNGTTLVEAFEKSETVIQKNLMQTKNLFSELQKKIKNEKISQTVKSNEIK